MMNLEFPLTMCLKTFLSLGQKMKMLIATNMIELKKVCPLLLRGDVKIPPFSGKFSNFVPPLHCLITLAISQSAAYLHYIHRISIQGKLHHLWFRGRQIVEIAINPAIKLPYFHLNFPEQTFWPLKNVK